MTPASIIPVFGSQRPYADLNFAGGSFGLDGRSVSDLTALPGFTFTRASLAMGYDATGKLTYGPNNLLLQSQTFDNASWTKTSATVTADAGVAPDGTTTADKIVVNNGVAAGRVQQVVSATAGTRYLVSAYVKPSGWNWFALRVAEDSASAAYFDVGTGAVGSVESGWSSASITSAGNGWYRIAAVYTALVGSYTWRFLPTNANSAFPTGDGVNGSLAWGLQVEAVTYQTTPSTYYPTTTAAYYGPRLVYDPVTLASQGILVEEARTNVLTQSQNLSTVLTVSNSTLTGSAATAPDGATTATSLMETVANASHWAYHGTANGVSATTYTYSLFIKANGRSAVWLNVQASANNYFTAVFDLSGVSVSQTSVGGTSGTISASSIQSVGNGWYRCVVTGVVTGTSSFCVGLATAPTGNTFTSVGVVSAYVGDITKGAYIWQIQAEAATGASSPIPTTTASVTRAADDARLTGLTFGTGYSVVASWQENFDDAAGFRCVLSISSAALTRESALYQRHTNNTVRIFSTGDMDLTIGTGNALTANTAAARFVTNDSTGSLNGAAAVAADTSTAPVASADRVFIGSQYAGGGNYLEGTISRIRIYNRALPDAQLQSLTT